MSLLLLLQSEYVDSFTSQIIEETLGIGTAPQEWTFILADKNGTFTDILDPAIIDCNLQYQRSKPTTATITLQGEDERAYAIISGLTTTKPLMYAYRDGVLEFAGFISSIREMGDEDLGMSVIFTDALGVLAYRLTDPGFEVYDETTTNLIAGTLTEGLSLVDQANSTAIVTAGVISRTAVPTGLTATAATTGFAIDTFATSRDRVLDKIIEISELTNGPDLRVTPVDGSSTFGTLEVGTLYQGLTVGAYFGYGEGTVANLTSFDWEIQPPATRVTCVGNDCEGSSTVNAAVTTAEAIVGVWQTVITNNDITEESDCIDAANAAMRLDWQTVVNFTPEPSVTPRVLRDYTIGDLVNVRADRGSLLYNGTLRVSSIGIRIDDSGFEVAHQIECEAGGPGATQQIMENQISATYDTVSATNGLRGSFA